LSYSIMCVNFSLKFMWNVKCPHEIWGSHGSDNKGYVWSSGIWLSAILKMETVGSSRRSAHIYQIIWHHISEDRSVHIHCHETTKKIREV
jgi:hypothetical protein